MPKKQSMITIDPGNNTGWAFWNSENIPETGIIRSTELDLTVFLSYMNNYMDGILTHYAPGRAVVEGVEVWGSLTSITAARRGNLTRLSYLIGSYCSLFIQHNMDFKIVVPREWKGQLNKSAVALRVKRAIASTYSTDHVTDAVGIGLAERGLL